MKFRTLLQLLDNDDWIKVNLRTEDGKWTHTATVENFRTYKDLLDQEVTDILHTSKYNVIFLNY